MKNDSVAKEQIFSGLVDELKKVSWPTRQETINLTIVVVTITLIIGFYIGIIDILLTKALEFVTKR